jgi:hypothetical protein
VSDFSTAHGAWQTGLMAADAAVAAREKTRSKPLDPAPEPSGQHPLA